MNLYINLQQCYLKVPISEFYNFLTLFILSNRFCDLYVTSFWENPELKLNRRGRLRFDVFTYHIRFGKLNLLFFLDMLHKKKYRALRRRFICISLILFFNIGFGLYIDLWIELFVWYAISKWRILKPHSRAFHLKRWILVWVHSFLEKIFNKKAFFYSTPNLTRSLARRI